MKTAFLFSGQNSQFVGMSADLSKNEIAENTYGNAQKVTGVSIFEISEKGPKELLNKSRNTQLAIVTLQASILNIIKDANISSDVTAGLSLGEYSALYNAGALTQEDMFKLVKARGEIMEDFALKNPGSKMMVVLGLNSQQTDSYIEQLLSQGENIAVSNYNSLQQQVIAGDIKALNTFKTIASDAKRVLEIDVAVPSHTKLMEPIVQDFTNEINKIKFQNLNQIFYGNIIGEKTTSQDVKEGLINQLTNPTYMDKTIRNMLKEGVDVFVEIGPKKILGQFVQKIAQELQKPVTILLAKDLETTQDVVLKLKEITNE